MTAPRQGLPDVDDQGVDLTLVRWSLSLTPLERLEILAGMVALAEQAQLVLPGDDEPG